MASTAATLETSLAPPAVSSPVLSSDTAGVGAYVSRMKANGRSYDFNPRKSSMISAGIFFSAVGVVALFHGIRILRDRAITQHRASSGHLLNLVGIGCIVAPCLFARIGSDAHQRGYHIRCLTEPTGI